MPGITGVVSDSADVPVALADHTVPGTQTSNDASVSVAVPSAPTLMLLNLSKASFL